MKKRRRKKKSKISEFLNNSPINYFSDLFIVSMVLAWLVVLLIMVIMGIYSTVKLSDNSVWSEVGTLVAVPLSCGGAIWMIKNSVQHAIASQKGTSCPSDFPKVEVDDFTMEDEITSENAQEGGIG